MRCLSFWPLLLTMLIALLSPGWAQAPKTSSDPQALTLAAQTVRALTGGTALNDAEVTGTIIKLDEAGQYTGTVTFKALGLSDSRMDVSLSDGESLTEVRSTSSANVPQGAWEREDGIVHAMPEHNCWSDATWPFPARSSLIAALSDPTVVLSYVGQETKNGITVQHVRSMRYFSSPDPTASANLETFSTVDFYLDSLSLLPVDITFSTHTDADEKTNLPVEIRFAYYQAVNGIAVPFRIQKLLSGGLMYDITITGASFNNGFTPAQFALP